MIQLDQDDSHQRLRRISNCLLDPDALPGDITLGTTVAKLTITAPIATAVFVPLPGIKFTNLTVYGTTSANGSTAAVASYVTAFGRGFNT